MIVAPLLALVVAAAPPLPTLVPFSAAESVQRLERSKHKADFFVLANHYEGQVHGGMCGPATAVIVLNALRVGNDKIVKPRDTSTLPPDVAAAIPKQWDPFFSRYTQATFLDDRFTAVKPREVFWGRPDASGKRDGGLQLRQLHDILVKHGVSSTIRIVDDHADEAKLKAEVVANLGAAGDYVIVNYTRAPLGQKGGGHISPLGAFDEASDSFLVLDVNPNEGKTWVWVPSTALFAAMRTKDTIENRGFLLVREGP